MYMEPLNDKKLDFVAGEYDIKTRQAFKVLKLFLDDGLRLHHKRLWNKMNNYHLRFENKTVYLSSFSETEKIVFIDLISEYLKLQPVKENLLLIRKLHIAHYKGKFYYLDDAIKSGDDVQIMGVNGKGRKMTTLYPIDVSIANPKLRSSKYLRKYHQIN